MRRSVIVSLLILLFIGAVGGACEWYNGRIVQRYTETLSLLGAELGEERWDAAQRRAEKISLEWEREMGWVQLWINHADTDAVTHALRGLQTSIRARDPLSAALYYGDCLENFAHLHHRDAFTLKNIL